MYVPQLTFTRFIAALAIVFFHFAQELEPFTGSAMHMLLSTSNIAVSFFFILSGFVMIVSNANKEKIDTLHFYKKRFLRIYPIYLISTALLFVVFALAGASMDIDAFVLNILMLHAWIPSKSMSFNFPTWSICVEVFFYFLFPYIYNYLFRRFSIKYLAVFIVLIWVVSQIITDQLMYAHAHELMTKDERRFIFFFPLWHLNAFLIGNLIGQLFVQYPAKRNYTVVILLCIACILLAMLFPLGFVLQNGILSIFFAPLIYFIAKDNSAITQLFSRKGFLFLGEISYALYMLQNPVFVWMEKILKLTHVSNPQTVFYLSLTVLLIASALVYVITEKLIYSKHVLRDFGWVK